MLALIFFRKYPIDLLCYYYFIFVVVVVIMIINFFYLSQPNNCTSKNVLSRTHVLVNDEKILS